MTPTLGFVLLTYEKPQMIRRLMNRLDAMFDSPPIVCHHDFSKCDLATDGVPPGVSFVRPHTVTAWAQFSAVEAVVRAVGQMYEAADGPDWFVVLSGADYPIKPAARILEDLRAGSCDAFMHHELIQAGAFEHDWQALCHYRYCLKEPNPFTPEFRCFAGSFAFCASRRAAREILEFHERRPELAEHYRGLLHTDESYFQCILANSPRLRLRNDNLRYDDWSAGGPHPKTLTLEDLPKLLASPAHFARKFDAATDARILDELDAVTS